VLHWRVGARSRKDCYWFAHLAERIEGRFQLTTDAFRSYAQVVEAVLGKEIDYGELVKIYGTVHGAAARYGRAECIGPRAKTIIGNPDEKHISTSYAERNNLNIRMHSRRMTRLTNAFSKKVANHAYAMALHFLYYNFVRSTLEKLVAREIKTRAGALTWAAQRPTNCRMA
jgi:IS1 family transposase